MSHLSSVRTWSCCSRWSLHTSAWTYSSGCRLLSSSGWFNWLLVLFISTLRGDARSYSSFFFFKMKTPGAWARQRLHKWNCIHHTLSVFCLSELYLVIFSHQLMLNLAVEYFLNFHLILDLWVGWNFQFICHLGFDIVSSCSNSSLPLMFFAVDIPSFHFQD